MRKISTRIGTIISWYDYIKSKKNKNSDTISYDQSNTKLEGYSQRYIGIHLSHNKQIFVAVAVNKKEDNSNWWKFIIQNRITNLVSNKGNMSPDDKGMTVVPISYKDLLFKDPFVYNNLYGLIDPTYLDLVLKEAQEMSQREISKYESRLRESTQAPS